ncbi:hypothetical protein B0H65DRAFT_180136 [Neurospora tetraspora]|uniref:Uncharacterized protein n=1 Tax=Neurospora tetraspora TaxID=94610 RepID=A0AAE0MR32_9PEZI|nr:hypothetical protein B0H65DRAFT_180136 [Neurospora tetraspora]
MLNYIEKGYDDPKAVQCIEKFYSLTLQCFQSTNNERLWLKTNTGCAPTQHSQPSRNLWHSQPRAQRHRQPRPPGNKPHLWHSRHSRSCRSCPCNP